MKTSLFPVTFRAQNPFFAGLGTGSLFFLICVVEKGKEHLYALFFKLCEDK